MKIKRFRKLMICYWVFWLAGIGLFWTRNVNDYLIPFSVGYFIIGLPLASIVVSMLMVSSRIINKGRWILIFFFGIMYMLADYLTFTLANMRAFHKWSWPDLDSFLIGAACALIGLFIGTVLSRHAKRH